jgi:hypothetical protein
LTGFGAGERIASISDPPPSGRMRSALLAGATLAGAAVVGLLWLFIGSGSNSGVSASLASLGAAPGIAPPDYAYLDNAQVALYLGQLEGGIAKSEDLTQQLTQSRNAGVSVGGNSLGGSSGSSATAERVVTPTATARFYQLLDLLGRDGYLHKIDAAASPAKLKLVVPSFVQLLQVSLAAKGAQSPLASYLAVTQTAETTGSLPTSASAIELAEAQAGRVNHLVGSPGTGGSASYQRRLGRAIRALGKVGADPRIPLATCNGTTDYHPRGVDLLFPIRLANLSTEQSLLAGPVTLMGKLVRAVRTKDEQYADSASFATFSGPTQGLDSVLHDDQALSDELDADAVVLDPGAVILPIAIYK